MRARQDVPTGLIQLAAEQSGVLSRSQALGSGVSPTVIRRLFADGRWGRLVPGIYLVPDTAPSWAAMVWAGVLLGGTEARAGGLAAAKLQGLTDDERLPIEILVPFGVKPTIYEWVVFRQERVNVRAMSTGAQPPRTRIEDTVLDLCAAGIPAECVCWVTTAVQRRLTTPEALARALGRRARIPHRRLIDDLLHDVASGVHSALEYRYLHDVERAHGLPRPIRQASRPGRNVFVDVLYREFGLIVELDGRVGHVEEGRWRDRRRDNVHAASGALTLRFGWHEITDEPCAVALDVAEALVRRGWSGYPATCSRCADGSRVR